jgi:hypothetical protein
VFNTIFNNICLYHGGQFYWWRNPEYLKETKDLLQGYDKLIIIYSQQVGIKLTA